jgi:hypothetical protein
MALRVAIVHGVEAVAANQLRRAWPRGIIATMASHFSRLSNACLAPRLTEVVFNADSDQRRQWRRPDRASARRNTMKTLLCALVALSVLAGTAQAADFGSRDYWVDIARHIN